MLRHYRLRSSGGRMWATERESWLSERVNVRRALYVYKTTLSINQRVRGDSCPLALPKKPNFNCLQF